ncbi:MAG TPA: hydantoinase/oxoprolinase family protein [Chloroflexota bacterium]|jgi:N-methylhydantoinase A
MPYRIGVDIGGTFTDLSLLDEQSERIVATHKLPSRPADPVGAVADGVAALLTTTSPAAVRALLHGSTVGLNALLAESEPPPALLTTEGFRDVYELGRQWRGEQVYDLFLDGPRMLLPRWQILEVPERVGARGEIVRPLDEGAAEALVERVLALGVHSVAVALLFAFANSAHERLLGRLFRERAPELHVSLSSEVSPEFREYERTATTVANAYIGPRMAQYVARFERELREALPAARVLIMQSNGGTATAGAVVRVPVRTLMSGPVAGVVASKFLGDQVGTRHLLTIDIGGTSCDMAVLPGELSYTTQSRVGGHIIRTPSVDIHTIGSGGGSIAWLGPGGVLKVGPQSAGAEPGPACYGRGGTLPTLTDALLVLGYLGERSFLGGRMAIQAAPAEAAIATHVATPLGMSVQQAAAGIVRVLSNQVALAMRSITVERGHDPREFTLVAFGGAGPTLAAHLARELSIPRVLVPREPGNFCAFGMLVSDLRHDVVRTRIGLLDDLPDAEILGHFDTLSDECARELAVQGAPGEVVLERYCDMRYVGQSYEVLVPLAAAAGALDRAALQADFHRLHERRYGHKAPDEPVEVVAFRVRGIGVSAKPTATPEPTSTGPAPAAVEERAVLLDADAGAVPTPVYWRDGLRAGQRLVGPCIVEEPSSTTVVVPDAELVVDGFGNLVLTLTTDQPAAEGADGQGRRPT